MVAVRWMCVAWTVVLAACGSSGTTPSDSQPPIDGPPPLYELAAVRPAIANAGATISLEGTFGRNTTVTFPGGVDATATVTGLHRATVTVPAGATAGTLAVTSDGHVLGTAPFRASTFALGVFGPDDYADGARQTPALVTPRGGHASFVAGNRLYVIGGTSSTATLSSIEQAIIDGDGSIEAFTTVTGSSLATARTGLTATAIGGYVYVIGGNDGTAALASVERAPLASDGTLGAFAVLPDVHLASARYGHTAVVIGNGLYVVGGTDGANALASVERAEIAPDGTLSPFAAVAGVQLATARSNHASVVIGDLLYVLGGTGAPGPLASVEIATIFPDGQLSTFTTVAGLALPKRATTPTAFVLGDYVYVVGGKDDSGNILGTSLATIHPDGSLGGFADASSATQAGYRFGHTTELVGNHLYVIGGTAQATGNVQCVAIDVGGALGTFTATSVGLTTARAEQSTVVLGKYLYVIGGSGSAASSIERVTINDDGSLSTLPTVYSVTLATGRAGAAVAVIGGYLYVIGGRATDGTLLGTIERSTIGSDGSLGTFSLVSGVTLTNPRYGHTVAVYGGAVFVIGGHAAAGPTGSIERSLIAADGSLGAFAASVNLGTPRSNHSQLVVGGRLLVLGGNTSVAPTASIESAYFSTDGSGHATLTGFGPAGNLTTPRAYHKSFQLGTYVYVVGGTGTTAVERTAINGYGTTGDPFKVVPGVTLNFTQPSTAIVGNTLYVVAGLAVLQASLQ